MRLDIVCLVSRQMLKCLFIVFIVLSPHQPVKTKEKKDVFLVPRGER